MSEGGVSTEMEVIIKGMASIAIPDEILKGHDYKELIQNFRRDYNELDNLKAARQAYESRSVRTRLWDGVKLWEKDKLEAAKLDAAELQASFSKNVGKLLIISHAQSFMLDQQQRSLQEQQHEIEKQTKRIADANDVIKQQQNDLGEQQGQLKKLIDDYFELKGLTADGAKKLIQVAEEIKGTKNTLIVTFEDQHREFLELQQHVDDYTQQQLTQAQELDAHREQIATAIATQSERFDVSIAAHRREMDERQRRQEEQFHAEQESLKQQLEQLGGQQRQFIEHQLAELKANTSTQVVQAKRLAIIGLCSASAIFLWLLWEHRGMVGL